MQGYFAREPYFGCRKAIFLMQKSPVSVGLCFERGSVFQKRPGSVKSLLIFQCVAVVRVCCRSVLQ